MVNTLTATMIAALLGSFVIAVFLLPIVELNQNYAADIDTTNLESVDRLNDLSEDVTGLRKQAVDDSNVDTQESEASFFTNAFTVGKFIFTGGPLSIMEGMLRDFFNFTPFPPIVYVFLTSVLVLVITIALVRTITGK